MYHVELTDSELKLLKMMLSARMVHLSRVKKSPVDEQFKKYIYYALESTQNLFYKIKSIIPLHQPDIDIKINIADELDGD